MNLSQFDTPRDQRYFEDYHKGAEYQFGPIEVEENELIEFARRFDPQSIHIDPDAAARGPFNGLIASGWHTVGLMMRLYVDHYVTSVASLASPGVDEVRWRVPVRPGDQLRLRVSTVETRLSRSKPDRGLVHSRLEAINQNDEVVATLTAMNLIARREPGEAA
ncbi:MaoC family dehydratase [Alloalcanivorax mobilis]|uniref:MaoC family dehydratase n=1 Tax=Alloalcanivorax mobilis TaxID=2019569 RepID=UPI0018E4C392|nr:MaoC family dehydratase [Alloalcanivorax mobilis]|tara:strand:+ start:10411 stop:10899 length:489 start_codon:yes stop_codon:yes gene_type:complete